MTLAASKWLFLGDGKRLCCAIFQALERLEVTFSGVKESLARIFVDDEISFVIGSLRGSHRFSSDDKVASLIIVDDEEYLQRFLHLLRNLGVQLYPASEYGATQLFNRAYDDLRLIRSETTAVETAAYIHVLISVFLCIHRIADMESLESNEKCDFLHLHLKRARVANSEITVSNFRLIKFPFPEIVENTTVSDSKYGKIDDKAVLKLIQISDVIGRYLSSNESKDTISIASINNALSGFYAILRVARSSGGKSEV